MEKIFQWIEENPKKAIRISVITFVVLVVGVPMGIHICYINPAPVWWMKTEWNSGSMLEYYGTVLGFLGTVALSALALYQNYELKKESDVKQALLEKMEYAKEIPIFNLKNYGCNGNYMNLRVQLNNISDNVACEIEVGNFEIEDINGNLVAKSDNVQLEKTELSGNDSFVIRFQNKPFSGENLKISFQMVCKDKFQKKHKYHISSQIEDTNRINTKAKFSIIEI